MFAGKHNFHQKTSSKQGPGKVRVRSRQCKQNLDLNYNMMGFDTIKINLVQYSYENTANLGMDAITETK